MPGIIAVESPAHTSDECTSEEVAALEQAFRAVSMDGFPLIVLCDNATFTAQTLDNLVWVAFTRSNPSADIHGFGSFTEHKHWGCTGTILIDARKKAHHAPELIKDPAVEKRVDKLGARGSSLYGMI
jgi:4-hydroxy-3-polyprenylbenzoate decarboxylase